MSDSKVAHSANSTRYLNDAMLPASLIKAGMIEAQNEKFSKAKSKK